MAAAQSQNTVTLKFYDGDGITGELVDFTDGVFKIDSLIGSVTIPSAGVSCIGAACPEETRLSFEASPLVLTSLDGSISISGDLLEIVDGNYVIATEVGELRLDTAQVTCEGEGCLEAAPSFAFGGPVVLTNGTTTIEGKLTGIDDDAYVIESTTMGLIRVSSDQFRCSGAGCPNR